jgi:hypothetical protein
LGLRWGLIVGNAISLPLLGAIFAPTSLMFTLTAWLGAAIAWTTWSRDYHLDSNPIPVQMRKEQDESEA